LTKTIENTVFDLGNVLVPVEKQRAYKKIEPYLPSDLKRLLREDTPSFELLLTEPAVALESGAISFDEFETTVKSTLGIDSNDIDFHTIYCDVFSLNRPMVELGSALSQRYNTCLASNTSEVHYEWILERFPEVAFYKAAALSYELRVMKPDIEYFRKAINLFNIDPQRSVFIDDLEENVVAAIECEMNGIVFKGYASLIPELERLGVEVPNSERGMS
jgi:FMN phosphatase YigB (HAD superfamily)